jgi:hypothetical protein
MTTESTVERLLVGPAPKGILHLDLFPKSWQNLKSRACVFICIYVYIFFLNMLL